MNVDRQGRTIDYLRISITDRCNLRCRYCMPQEGVTLKPHDAMLTFEEILQFVAFAAEEGFSRIRLTGGEPLARLGVTELVRSITRIPGIESVVMTTNGTLLPKLAESLREAGLVRVNISLDTLDSAQFNHITRGGNIDDVFAGIDAALRVGFKPVKINTVVIRSLKQDVLAFARLSLNRPLHVRFIEYMPIGNVHSEGGVGWSAQDVIPSEELVQLISERAAAQGLGRLIELNDAAKPEGWGPARSYRFEGAQGTVGFISPLSRCFCDGCNRLRMTAEGKLRPCLFSDLEFDAKPALRSGDTSALRQVFREALLAKADGHYSQVGTDRPMSQIGG
jgi:cyclic pyranopterin phosphate synthase